MGGDSPSPRDSCRATSDFSATSHVLISIWRHLLLNRIDGNAQLGKEVVLFFFGTAAEASAFVEFWKRLVLVSFSGRPGCSFGVKMLIGQSQPSAFSANPRTSIKSPLPNRSAPASNVAKSRHAWNWHHITEGNATINEEPHSSFLWYGMG